jgi:peptidoglycan hydrolase-like protein with peptidoglycan-binding domain
VHGALPRRLAQGRREQPVRRRSWLYPVTVFIAVAVLIGAGAWLALALRGQLAALDAPPVPVVVEVREAQLDYSSAASLTGRRVAPEPVLWNGSAGTVTAVHAGSSDELGTGSAIVDVDGVTLRAYTAGTALFRSLSRGDKGADVKVAQELLNVLVPGASLSVSGTFGSATASAVRAYEKSLGTTPTGVLDPRWFLMLPTDTYRVASVALRVGQPAPAPGAAFLDGVTTVEGLKFEVEGGGPDGAYRFSYLGSSYDVTLSEGAWTLVDEAALAALLDPKPGATSDAEGAVEEETTPPSDTTGSVTVDGRVALTDPEPGQAVPPAALVLDPSGASCVLLAGDHSPAAVTLIGSAVDGSALIAPELGEGARVLVNPLEVVPEAECP